MGHAEVFAVNFGDFGHEIQGVDWLRWGIPQEVGDVEYSTFVLNYCFFAVECQVPDAEALPDHKTWGSVERGSVERFLSFDF